MFKRNLVLFATALVVIAATFMVGCGGGGGTPPRTGTTAPSFTTQLPATATATSCSTAVSWPVAASGNPAPTISAVVSTGSGTVVYNGGQVTFTPTCTNAQQSVKVTATATNSAGSATTSVTITVPAQATAPTFTTTLPSTANVNCGTQASWPVAASGTPAPTIAASLTGAGSASFSNGNVVYTAPACSASAATATVTATASNSAGNATTAVAVTVPAAVAPTVSISCPKSTLLVNSSMDCTLTVGGTPAPTVTASAVHGTTTVSGTVLHYTAPSEANADTITVNATNGVGSGAVATWNLQVTVDLRPTFSGANLASAYGSYISFVGLEAQGSNFNTGDQLEATPVPSQFQASYVSSSKMNLYFAIDRMAWNPGRFDVVDTNSHGSSNPLHIAHRSNANMAACSTSQCYLLDSANFSTVYTFDRSSGQKVGERAIMAGCNGCIGFQGIAYDDLNQVYLSWVSRSIVMYKANGSGGGLYVGDPNREVFVTNAAAGYGHACLADAEFDATNNLIYFSTTTNDSHPGIVASDLHYLPVAFNGQHTVPATVGIAKVDNQVVCNVYDTAQKQLVSVNIPQGTIRYQTTVASLATDTTAGTNGGWWNLVLSNGNNVLVSSYEKVVVIHDSNGSEIRRVNLSGTAILATLDSSGNVIVAEYDDPVTGIVRFEKVNPSNGSISSSSATITDFFPTGLFGTAVGNRSTYRELVY